MTLVGPTGRGTGEDEMKQGVPRDPHVPTWAEPETKTSRGLCLGFTDHLSAAVGRGENQNPTPPLCDGGDGGKIRTLQGRSLFTRQPPTPVPDPDASRGRPWGGRRYRPVSEVKDGVGPRRTGSVDTRPSRPAPSRAPSFTPINRRRRRRWSPRRSI